MSGFNEEYEKNLQTVLDARKFVSEELHEQLVALCQKNGWLKKHGYPFVDDPFLELDSPYKFISIEDIGVLKLFFQIGNWAIRTGVVHGDLFFCNQVNGGDEWWTCRYDRQAKEWVPFESITFRIFVEEGSFENLIHRMSTATVEQCKNLTY